MQPIKHSLAAMDSGQGGRTVGRLQEIEPFRVMDLLAQARQLEAQGQSIIHMEIGEPDFTTPQPVMAAAREALDSGKTHYTPALGLGELREAIALSYRDTHGVEVDPQRVVVTPGASGALLLALGLLLNPGDQVLMSDPGYPCNRNITRIIEGKAHPIAVDESSAFQLTAEHIRANWGEQTVAAMVATPSNPTGTLIPRQQMAALISAVSGLGGSLVVDEIYQGLIYDGGGYSALELSDQILLINSFSKYFSMTGWRVGWLVVPDPLRRDVEKLMQNLFIAAPTLAQYAALAAFSQENLDILEERRLEFARRRDFLLPALQRLGFVIPTAPGGAFYLYADCSRHSSDSQQLAHELLHRAGVAVTPGVDFGSHQPQRYLRFAYTTSLENLQIGVERIERFLNS